MSKTVLFSRPWDDEGTSYLHAWTDELVEKAFQLNHKIIDLRDKRSNKKDFTSHLDKSRPSFVHLNGHGNSETVTGYNEKPILDISNAKSTKGKIIYARACSSARILGAICIKKGAKCYIGYRRPFVVRVDLTMLHKPKKDKVARYTLGPSNKITMSLLKGHSAEKAFNKSQQESRKCIQKLLSSEAPEGASHILMAVYSNMKNQVLLGSPDSII